MIVRTWRGHATAHDADRYPAFVTSRIFPELAKIDGHRGAFLLKRKEAGEVEFLVVTLWETMEAIGKFAGANPGVAVVEPEAKAALSSFDDRVEHYELAWGRFQTT